MYDIAVLGAGVIGVSSALNIQKLIPSARAKIISEKFGQETTSWGSGGLFRPCVKYIKGIHEEKNKLVGQYDVVVNCTGLGSRSLFGDTSISPVRGQLLRVKATWIKHFIFTEDYAYVIPNYNGADVDHEWAGLRPIRVPIRIEKEMLQLKKGRLVVVHNYGQRAHGIGLSWGTSLDAAELVKNALLSSKL